ncbi:MAG: LysR family transcriptional regulator [Hyphomicrobiales bacterium]|nr:MAG: LysR family transcriptional regulator [Hyphomicrobiales bacterium]
MSISPKRPKGPPLNALRAFEAAARLNGFAAAAEELSVTPGAVAQHIKALEAWVGAPLFERRSQGVALTPLGARSAERFSAAFDALGDAVDALRGHASGQEIRIAAMPSVAQLWLMPRLPALRRALPQVAVSVTASEVPPNLRREPFDLCLFFQDGSRVTAEAILGQDVIVPVCAPHIAAALRNPDDLSGATFLHDANWAGDWPLWLDTVLPGHRIDTTGPLYSLYAMAVEEAVAGAGVLMGHTLLLQRQIEAGQLVPLFDRPMALDRYLTITTARPVRDGSLLADVIAMLAA